MRRTFTFFTVCFSTLLFAGVANAQQIVNPLGKCVRACESILKLTCPTPDKRDLSKLCANIPECQGKSLSPGDLQAAEALLEACYEGATTQCPKNLRRSSGGKTAPPKGNLPPQPRLTPPAFHDECKSVGGFYLEEPDPANEGKVRKFCYTHQGMYNRILALEASLNAMHARVKTLEDGNLDVPFDLRRDYNAEKQLLMDIDKNVTGVSTDLSNLTKRVVRDYERIGLRLDALEQRMKNSEAMSSQAMGLAIEAKNQTRMGIAPALTGWSVTPYFTFQAHKAYGEFMRAGGAQLGVYPSLSLNGRHRLAINLGIGKAGDYFDQSMMQHHVNGGYSYFGPAGSIAVLAGVSRYSLTDVQQGRLFWAGPIVQGKVNIVKFAEDGKGANAAASSIFLTGSVGAGYRWVRHGILDTRVEPVQGRFDVPFLLGIGFQDASFF
jgi:hypothetical protein